MHGTGCFFFIFVRWLFRDKNKLENTKESPVTKAEQMKKLSNDPAHCAKLMTNNVPLKDRKKSALSRSTEG